MKIDFVLANSADPDEMPHKNAALCGISSGSSLFTKVPVYGFPVYQGLRDFLGSFLLNMLSMSA